MNYLNPQLRRLVGKDERHFCPTTPMADMRELHLYYPLATLQKEIEKRTSYLGRYRRPEDVPSNDPNVIQAQSRAQHLLDLIGMTRDEGDVLYSFAKAAMADVYDHLNSATPGYPKIYDWENKKAVVGLADNTKNLDGLLSGTISSIGGTVAATVHDEEYVILSGTVTVTLSTDILSGDETILKQYVPNASIALTIHKQSSLKSDPEQKFNSDKTITVRIGAENIVYGGVNGAVATYNIIPIKVVPALMPESEFVTAEIILNGVNAPTATVDDVDAVPFLAEPKELKAGTRFTFGTNQTVHETGEDCNENQLRESDLPEFVITLATNDTYFEEGIHYYFGMPGYLSDSLIGPLDNAILEALVNRIIYKWLVLSYPEEAAAYDKFYMDACASLRKRCNIYNKNWVNRTPRTY